MIIFIVKSMFCLIFLQTTCNAVQVEVQQGILEGKMEDLVTGDGQFYSFRGIPYALAPYGKLRFMAPQPPLNWTGVRNATQHGSKCPQYDILTGSYVAGDEDCLFLNVYSKNLKPDELMSVMVFIHGGAYKSGSGDDENYGPDFIVSKDVVVVTMNYRLDALGFLCVGTEDVPGNAGLKDQVAALQWVQSNIEQFGGDPRKVTLMGQSSGGASVSLHIASPMSKGLFHRAIAMSGSSICEWSVSVDPVRRAFVLGKNLGIDTKNPEELIEYLQSLPAEQLINTTPNILSNEVFMESNLLKMYHFVPVVEKFHGKNNFLTYDIFKKVDHVNKVDIMFGHTQNEVVALIDAIVSSFLGNYTKYPEQFVQRQFLQKLGPVTDLELSDKIINYHFGNNSIGVNSLKEFVNYSNYASFVYDTLRFFLRLPNVEDTVRYSYKFSINSTRNIYGARGEKYGFSGPAHFDDLWYCFDPKSANFVLDTNSTEFQLIDKISTIFTNFAKYREPCYNATCNITWPSSNDCTKLYVNLENNSSEVITTVSSRNDDDNFNFWEEIYSSLGL